MSDIRGKGGLQVSGPFLSVYLTVFELLPDHLGDLIEYLFEPARIRAFCVFIEIVAVVQIDT